MNGPGETKQLPSMYVVWVKSFSLLLVLFFVLFITFATAIIFTRADRNIASLLERSLSINKEEYSKFFVENTGRLNVMASALQQGALSDYHALPALMNGTPSYDLWFITNQQGQILSSSGNDSSVVLRQLSVVAQPSWLLGRDVASSEVVALPDVRAFSISLAQRATIDLTDAAQETYGALFQVVAVPYRSTTGGLAGALVAAHLVNNDTSVARRLAMEIPNAFSSISVGGVRVSSNIASRDHATFVGQLQTTDLVSTVSQGKRYYGRVKLDNDFDHLVVADPIRNSAGEVIGAMTTGHPSQGLASLKQDTAIYIALSALLCWGAVLGAGALASKRWAMPIARLSRLAKQISEVETIHPEHLSLVQDLPSANMRELEDLQRGFGRMTLSLYEKNQAILGYLTELEVERNELEVRVEAKTLELRNAMLDLAASSNLKSKLLANTSHELRTPLNAIIGFSDMLTGDMYGELTEEQRERVQIIGDSARYLLQLINDLLDVSLLQQGKMSLEMQPVHLKELVDSVLTMLYSTCEQRGIAIHADQEEKVPPVVGDPTRLKQVLYNVLTNAVKFTPAGGSIAVRVGALPGKVVIAVTDTGIGISEADQLQVFDEFYQAENVGDRKQEGFGLGLPLSKKIVELHGGRIELQSALGQGTTVTIHVPAGTAGESPAVPTEGA